MIEFNVKCESRKSTPDPSNSPLNSTKEFFCFFNNADLQNFVCMKQKAMLIILDGWGQGKKDHTDAVFNAHTPFIDRLLQEEPHTSLLTHGENVGLPEGQMGNSEVGHLNIGAGRIVWQMLVRINKALEDGSIRNLPGFQHLLRACSENSRKIHLMGLLSDGGVHSSLEHLEKLSQIFKAEGLASRTYLHAFLDGRDTDPHSGLHFLQQIKKSPIKLGTVIGRYYAMDRDKRWERVKRAYDLVVQGKGSISKDITETIQHYYRDGISDEFMEPIIVDQESLINPDDIVLFFNFRTDRGRELTTALTQKEFPEHDMKPIPLNFYTLTEYDKTFKNISIIFDNQDLEETMGEVISNAHYSQVRAAETEKYPHVTFFFSGGREEIFPGEKRIMIPSPKVPTYDLQPEMSALELRDAILASLDSDAADFYCINFANPDMVGHTGVFEAIVSACETVDSCANAIVDKAKSKGYAVMIIADHGNAEQAINEDGSPNTAHSTNPVHCIITGAGNHKLRNGILADVAPTLLHIMGIDQPKAMTGGSLIL